MEHISNASAADAEFVAALGDADFCAPLAAATVPLSAASAASASSESLDSLAELEKSIERTKNENAQNEAKLRKILLSTAKGALDAHKAKYTQANEPREYLKAVDPLRAKEVFGWLSKAASLGCDESATLLANALVEGDVSVDASIKTSPTALAIHLYAQAAENGHVPARQDLACFLLAMFKEVDERIQADVEAEVKDEMNQEKVDAIEALARTMTLKENSCSDMPANTDALKSAESTVAASKSPVLGAVSDAVAKSPVSGAVSDAVAKSPVLSHSGAVAESQVPAGALLHENLDAIVYQPTEQERFEALCVEKLKATQQSERKRLMGEELVAISHKCLDWLLEEAQKEDELCTIILSECFRKGYLIEYTMRDVVTANMFLYKLARKGSIHASAKLGMMVAKDISETVAPQHRPEQWFAKSDGAPAITNTTPSAQENLDENEEEGAIHNADLDPELFEGLQVLSGKASVAKKFTFAVSMLNAAAEQGHVESLVTFGALLMNCAGLYSSRTAEDDYKLSFKALNAATKAGHATAPMLLATLFYKGWGCEKNVDKAELALQCAIHRGESDAFKCLNVIRNKQFSAEDVGAASAAFF